MKDLITKQYIIGFIVILIIIVTLYYLYPTNPNYVDVHKKTIDSSQVKIDSLQLEIVKSDELIDSMNHELAILDKENEILKDKIIDIKKETYEKINAVDKLNNTELEHFFTERYQR
jgi:hypothetical protein